MTEEVFWVVWHVNGGRPTVQHRDFYGARQEAQRLARDNPGGTFAVMASVASYTKHDLHEVKYDLEAVQAGLLGDDLPF